jgi:hypothetical protein
VGAESSNTSGAEDSGADDANDVKDFVGNGRVARVNDVIVGLLVLAVALKVDGKVEEVPRGPSMTPM